MACKPSLLYFLYITSEVNSTIRRSLFIVQTSDRIGFVVVFSQFCKTNCIHSIFTTIEACANPCKANYRSEHIIKRFHKENARMSGLFSQINLLLCIIQGNDGLLTKTLKKA